MSEKQFMFDTNIFNTILDGSFDLSMLGGKGKFFTTHIQKDEINNTTNKERKDSLLQIFAEINSEKKPTKSAVYGVSKYGEAKYSENKVPTESFIVGHSQVGGAKLGDGQVYPKLLELLDKDKSDQHENNIKDALIGETAIKNNFTLVTNDGSLLQRSQDLGAVAINFEDFKDDQDDN